MDAARAALRATQRDPAHPLEAQCNSGVRADATPMFPTPGTGAVITVRGHGAQGSAWCLLPAGAAWVRSRRFTGGVGSDGAG